MSFFSDLKQMVRDELIEIADSIKDADASDVIFATENRLTTSALEKAISPIIGLFECDAERLDGTRYDKFVKTYAILVAEAMAIENLKNKRLVRSIPTDLEDELNESLDKFTDLCNEYQEMENGSSRRQRNRRDDRDDRDDRNGRHSSRENRSRRNAGGKVKTDRHQNSYERDDDVEDNDTSKNQPNPRHTQEDTVKTPILRDESVITESNFAALPPMCKDLPFYFAGLEQLTFNQKDKLINVNIVDGEFDVNYDEHRTDTYLSTNRNPIAAAQAIDKLEKELKRASIEKIDAYILKSTESAVGDDDEQVYITNPHKINKSCVVAGVYQFDLDVLGSEALVRKELVEILGEKMNSHVVGITGSHPLFAADELIQQTREWQEFLNLIVVVSMEYTLKDLVDLVTRAQKLFDPASYSMLHKLANAAVCNALSCTLKLGIKTSDFLNDLDAINDLIKTRQETDTGVGFLISRTLDLAMPAIEIYGNLLRVSRDYVFLPISKNDLTIASPIRYATIDKVVRPDLYNTINRLSTTNKVVTETQSLMTLVTLENESLMLFPNKAATGNSSYYIFQPIK